jgi:hypothetical protein
MNLPAEKMIEDMTLNDLLRQAGVNEDYQFADDILIHPERIPEPHQIRNLNSLLVNMTWGLFDEPGTMKTLPVQAWALYLAGHGHRVLAVMPPVLLDQFTEAMHFTFIGSETYPIHILDQNPYPVRISKKRVQDVKAALLLGEPVVGISPEILKIIEGMPIAQAIPFTDYEIDRIRETKKEVKAQDMAEEMSCSMGAISTLRSQDCRDDLYARWRRGDSWPQFLLMSYQMFHRVAHEVHNAYRVLIADEAHALCHPSSGTWKRVRRMLRNQGGNSAFVPMTGTPNPNKITDSYGLIKLLHPKAYSNYAQFEATHCNFVQAQDGVGKRFQVLTGYKNLDFLRQNLFAKASRVTKEQIFTMDKPSIFERDITLSKEHRAVYRRLVRDRVLEVDGEVISAIQAQSLRQKAARMVLCPDQFTDKVIKDNEVRVSLTELLDELGAAHQEKVLIFGIYNKSIEAMAEWFSDFNPAVVYGKSDSKKNVKKFLNDDTCRLMIAHYKSGGVGLNLQDVCRYVICVEPTSVPGEFLQAVERVYRKGQKKHVTFYIFRVLGTVWPKMVDSMRGKMALIKNVQVDRSEMLSELLGED